MAAELDIHQNRRAAKFSRKEIFRRLVWALVRPCFRFSPKIFWGWRNFLLRLMGARIGRHVRIHSTAAILFPWNLEMGDYCAMGDQVWIYNMGKIIIGSKTTISQRAHLCAGTHDYTDPTLPLLKPPIAIGSQSWICADAFVGPGVTVGEGAVVGARAVVTRDVDAWSVVAGNPACFLKKRVLG